MKDDILVADAKQPIEHAPWDDEIEPSAEVLVKQTSQSASQLPELSKTIEAPKAVEQATNTVSTSGAISEDELEQLTQNIVGALKTIYDPEIPVDIYELGLIYKIDIDDDRVVDVEMTLTAPGCPVAGDMPGWVENAVSSVQGVSMARVNLVFSPPWDQTRMSDEARIALNMF